MLFIILILFMILGYVVQARLKSKFNEYGKVPLYNGMTGAEVAEKMLHDNGIHDVRVISVPGKLSDHYNPSDKTVNLSPDVYHGNSVASAAVAAHECGHAVQHASAYRWLQMRSQMVPMVNYSSQLLNVIFILGIFGMVAFKMNYTLIIYAVIAAQAVITAFSLVTLPVEYDASNRALVWLNKSGMMNYEQENMAKDALKWAARTYLVAALAAVTTLIYYVMMLVNRD